MLKEYKQSLILLFFFLLTLMSIWIAFSIETRDGSSNLISNRPQTQEISEFFSSHYYINKKERPYGYLKSVYLAMNHNSNIASFKSPVGHLFTSALQIVNYKADEGDYSQSTKNINLNKNVIIYDEESEIKSNRVEYYQDQDLFKILGNVKSKHLSKKNGDKILINSDWALSWPNSHKANYYDNVVGNIIRKNPYEPQTDFAGQILQCSLQKSHIEIEKDVVIKRANMEAKALKGEIFLENYNKDINYYTLYDDVKITEFFKDEKKNINIQRKSYSEKLEGFTKLKKIVLTGYPKVIQGGDLVKGNMITFYEDSEIIEVSDNNSSFIIKGQ